MVIEPAIPANPLKIRKPYLSEVTNDVIKDNTPRPRNPASKMIDAGNKSANRPENNRKAAKVNE
jgi:hypothetical protein